MSPENPSSSTGSPGGEFDRKHLAPAFPVNPDRDQDRWLAMMPSSRIRS